MSGSFDHPPASGQSNGEDLTNFPARLRHIRQAFQRDRERDRVSREADRRARLGSTSNPRATSHRRRRVSARFDTQPQTDGTIRDGVPSSELSTSAARSRPRPPTLERIARRRRQQRDLRDETSSTLNALEEAGERLADISSRLGALLEPSRPLSITRTEDAEEADNARHRSKKRKLDHDLAGTGFQGFKYGHFGQIVPGNLKMEIVSCDGGEYSEDYMSAYRAENVLKNDRSVYCTKSPRCNLILRHQGETTFCLQKIVIQAPERGFTAPVQQGMIFVSMSSEDLLRDTDQYEMQYNSSSHTSPESSMNPRSRERLTLLESLHDPEIWEEYRSYQSRIDYLSSVADTVAERAITPRSRAREAWPFPAPDQSESPTTPDACVWPLSEPSSSMTAGDANPPPFTVTTESDGEGSDAEDELSAAVMSGRLHPDMRWAHSALSDDGGGEGGEDDDDDGSASSELVSRTSSDNARRERSREEARQEVARSLRRSAPSRISSRAPVADDGERSQERRDGRAAAPNSNARTPHAEFFIAKNRSKITVKFDPPVSGKFVLLKLWASRRDGNIDIQSVSAFGFAGPRYFPACQLR